MEKTNNITLPMAIVISAVVLGISFYAVQDSKQKSIERQQAIELGEEKKERDEDNKRAELKLKQEECESLSSGAKNKWNNVLGVTYDSELWKECVVTYTDPDTGEVETSPLRFMQDVD